MSRIVSWFSCGAASAVATKLAIQENRSPVKVVRCWLKEEHPDNDRFAADCAKWFGQEIQTIRNEKYSGSVDEVIRLRRFIVGPGGAPCTVHLKKDVRKHFQRPGDVQVFGYCAEEQDRIDRFIDANADVQARFPLAERGLTHADCLAMIERAGLELPVMYRLGYQHNNCIGCVKGRAGYWNKVRVDFPDRFAQMSKLERLTGAAINRVNDVPTYLDELLPDTGRYDTEPEIQCGIFCELAEQKFAKP